MNNKVKIALLDTGVNGFHPYLKNCIANCYEAKSFKEGIEVVTLTNLNNDFNGHGTACASVIKKEYPNIEIYSFKILNQKGICNLQILETVLSYIKIMDMQLINLSLTIIEKVDISDLSKICKELEYNNTIIISSLGNKQKKSYPAILRECIGVQGFIMDNFDSIWFNENRKIQCIVDNTPFMHCNVEGGYSMFGKCNSYASAKLTGIVASIIGENKEYSKRQIFNILYEKSEKKYWSFFDLKKNKRTLNIDEYKNQIDDSVAFKIENILRNQLNLKNNISLIDKFLFSYEIGLTYKHCYELVNNIEKEFRFKIKEYTDISREDFNSLYHLANLVKKHS